MKKIKASTNTPLKTLKTDATRTPPLLLARATLHLRHHLHTTAVCSLVRRPCHTSTAAESPRPIRKTPSHDDNKTSLLNAKRHPPKDPRWENDPDYCKWKDKEAEIFMDIDPTTLQIKHILHSDRYVDGEQLTSTDQKMVVDKLLPYHPHSKDKIGCGIDSIMVTFFLYNHRRTQYYHIVYTQVHILVWLIIHNTNKVHIIIDANSFIASLFFS
ncbi:putative protein DCL [Helianthus annuus]|nr:putative protein DCL [Helianthus annuus]